MKIQYDYETGKPTEYQPSHLNPSPAPDTAARTMFKMQKGNLMVFAEANFMGRGWLAQLRADDPRFTRARIVSVLQMRPEETPARKIIDIHGERN